MCAVHTGRGELYMDQRWRRASTTPGALLRGIDCDTMHVRGDSCLGVKLKARFAGEGRMASTLLTTKVYVPPVPPDLIARPRLIERLNANLDPRLTLIAPPVGYGKTTLLTEWTRRRGEMTRPLPVARLSLDEGDNNPVRFLLYFIAALPDNCSQHRGRSTGGAPMSSAAATANPAPSVPSSQEAL